MLKKVNIRLNKAAWRGIVIFAVTICLALTMQSSAKSAEWIYQRSYFTHDLPPAFARKYPIPESRSAYRPAYVGNGPGFSIRGGYRYNNYTLRSGSSTDTTIFRKNWVEITP